MGSTVFVDYSAATPIVAAWLNDVNDAVYKAIGTGGASPTAPKTPADVLANLGLTGAATAPQLVTSIAALRTKPKTGTQNTLVTGYYTSGDGGGGLYYLDPVDVTSPDNGGTIIVANDGGRWKLVVRGMLSVRQFGAKGDGATDDTAAMNNAHATGQVIYYPGTHTYVFSKLNPIASGGIVGDGRSASILQSTNTDSSDLIVFTSTAVTPIFKDFTLQAPMAGNIATKTGGAGIKLQPVSGEIDYAHFENVTIAFLPICLDTEAAAYWTVTNCEFLGYTTAGLVVKNLNNSDSGDSSVVGSLFNTPATTGAGIIQYSSGGLKITGNKFLGGANGYSLQLQGNTNTSDLLILGNSFEGDTQQNIVLARNSGTANFTNIVIVGNQFLVTTYGIQSDASGAFAEISIAGNVMNLQASATAGINLTACADFNISGMTFKGNGGTPNGINIAASCVNGKIGVNTYSGLTTTITNSSTTTFVQKDTQSGSTTTSSSGWATDGALYSSPSTSVTFPQAFSVAPSAADITLTPTSTNGVLGAIVTSVNTTGFTYNAISTTNSIAATLSWKAAGVI